MPQWVHRFGSGMAAVGDRDPNVVGWKGAGLAAAARAGLNVPPGFTLSTAACRAYHANGGSLPNEIGAALESAVRSVEAATGRSFGARGGADALTLAVRSSPSGAGDEARAGLGLMPTVQDIGYGGITCDPARTARAEASFLRSATGLDDLDIEEALEADDPLPALRALHEGSNEIVVPADPMDRLRRVVEAGFDAWLSDRAVEARRFAQGRDDAVALVVQAMAESVCPGIAMLGAARTRNARTGEKALRGFVVEGVPSVRDAPPGGVRRLRADEDGRTAANAVERTDPDLLTTLERAGRALEAETKRPMDVKFAIGPQRELWLLHASVTPMEGRASIRAAVEMVAEGVIDTKEAIRRVDPSAVEEVMHARVDEHTARTRLAVGMSASPGAASGRLVFTSDEAVEARERGEDAILVCNETGPEDIIGIQAAGGVLTTRGGRASHAAVVARGLGRPCVTGASSVSVDVKNRVMIVGDQRLGPDDEITVDGNGGEVLLGAVPLSPPALSGDFATLMGWADNLRRMRVRANADTPEDAKAALRFGAEGVGLCRTEHMFFDTHRMDPMREMILADTPAARSEALDRLRAFQKGDFTRLFELMAGLPVMIRLLDPPLHEFLPKTTAELNRAASTLDIPTAELRARVAALREVNPMLGHRGCRLAISYPEIARMQMRAILEAASEVETRTGRSVDPEIMVPLVGLRDELDYVKDLADEVAREVAERSGRPVRYTIGTMIELPRAALRAAAIAESAEFFSFGTNDLTQTTFGISRDDASPFLTRYREIGIMEEDPFVTLDRQGVGQLIRMACEAGRSSRPDIALSICGEHGGDPKSIAFCEEIGLDYVSCSPYRVPIARLAAAQAAIASERRIRSQRADGWG